ncbi:MAG: hypothetical protein ACRC9V_09185, partial [Aeromonas sp.]
PLVVFLVFNVSHVQLLCNNENCKKRYINKVELSVHNLLPSTMTVSPVKPIIYLSLQQQRATIRRTAHQRPSGGW